jgi:hypothetical protein
VAAVAGAAMVNVLSRACREEDAAVQQVAGAQADGTGHLQHLDFTALQLLLQLLLLISQLLSSWGLRLWQLHPNRWSSRGACAAAVSEACTEVQCQRAVEAACLPAGGESVSGSGRAGRLQCSGTGGFR